MPLYEYQCQSCHKIQEVMQKFSDPALTHCSQCDGELKKIISRSSFVLNGSGWHHTDYKSSGASKAPPACAASCEHKSCGA